jgi:hypothetical protein
MIRRQYKSLNTNSKDSIKNQNIFKRTYDRIICFFKECDGRTGATEQCAKCKAYNYTKTNCLYD